MSSSSRSPVVETGVTARSGRRRLTVEYKTWLVEEAERLRESGDVGAFLRREGVYSLQLAAQPNAVWTWDITELKGPNKGDHDKATPESSRNSWAARMRVGIPAT